MSDAVAALLIEMAESLEKLLRNERLMAHAKVLRDLRKAVEDQIEAGRAEVAR